MLLRWKHSGILRLMPRKTSWSTFFTAERHFRTAFHFPRLPFTVQRFKFIRQYPVLWFDISLYSESDAVKTTPTVLVNHYTPIVTHFYYRSTLLYLDTPSLPQTSTVGLLAATVMRSHSWTTDSISTFWLKRNSAWGMIFTPTYIPCKLLILIPETQQDIPKALLFENTRTHG